MRDKMLLSKAKRIDNGEWIEGFCHYTNWFDPVTKEVVCKNYHILPVGGQDSYEVDPETICRPTGKTDKNGKMIYINDICNYYNPVDKDGVAIIKDGFASWINGTIRKKHLMTPLIYLGCGEEWEIIGNCFDNPELLKGE